MIVLYVPGSPKFSPVTSCKICVSAGKPDEPQTTACRMYSVHDAQARHHVCLSQEKPMTFLPCLSTV